MRRICSGLAIAILIASVTVSCGGGSATNNASVKNAQLVLDSSSLAFGDVSVGNTKSNTITLTNSSSAGGPGIGITAVNASGTGYSVIAPTLPLTLSPGQSATASVTFAPKTSGMLNGTLTVAVSGNNQPVSVPLTGTGLAPGQLAVNSSAINFGNVDIGKSVQQSGTLTAGGSDVNVASANWNGAGFSLTGITFPTTVKAGTSTPFTVTFAPQGTGNVGGQVSFLSNATNTPTVVTLSGDGVQHTVALAWAGSTSQVAGYNIYRSTSSAGPYTKINSNLIAGLTFTDSGIQGGTTYFYAATSVDSSNNESAYSNIATAIIP